MDNIKIFVCSHRTVPLGRSDILIPMQMGSALTAEDLGMVRDDGDDNISGKNKCFCELTAQYWVWKNCQADYVGLFHYRRFLNFKNNEKAFHQFGDNFAEKFGFTEDNMLRLCHNYDIILPNKYPHIPGKISLYDAYARDHIKSDMDKTLAILSKKYPQMKETAEKVLKEQAQGYFMNIMISSKSFFDQYSAWLFDILFELEAQIKDELEKRDVYQKRVYGFISERLLNVYVEYLRQNLKIKIKELPLLFWEEDKRKWNRYRLKRFKRYLLSAVGLGKEKWKEQYV